MQWISHTHTGPDSHMSSISLGQLLLKHHEIILEFYDFQCHV